MGLSLQQNPVSCTAMTTSQYFLGFQILFQQPAKWDLSVQQWHHLSCLQSVPGVQRIWGNGVGAATASSQRTGGRLPASVTSAVRGGRQGQVQPPSRRATPRGRAERDRGGPGWAAAGQQHRKHGAPLGGGGGRRRPRCLPRGALGVVGTSFFHFPSTSGRTSG